MTTGATATQNRFGRVSVARLQTFLLDVVRFPAGQSNIRIVGMLNRYSITGVMLHPPNHVDCLVTVLAATPLAAENDGDDHFHCGFISEALSFGSATRSKYLLNHKRVTK